MFKERLDATKKKGIRREIVIKEILHEVGPHVKSPPNSFWLSHPLGILWQLILGRRKKYSYMNLILPKV